jgi:hypothetical protein
MVSKDVVKDGLEAFWAAVIDLTRQDVDVNLNFGFCRLVIEDRNLKVRFRSGFATDIKGKDFEVKMKRSVSPCSTFWKTSYNKSWRQSNLGKLLKQPESSVSDAMEKKTLALKLMSMDMSSSSAFKIRNVKKY